MAPRSTSVDEAVRRLREHVSPGGIPWQYRSDHPEPNLYTDLATVLDRLDRLEAAYTEGAVSRAATQTKIRQEAVRDAIRMDPNQRQADALLAIAKLLGMLVASLPGSDNVTRRDVRRIMEWL